MVISGHKQKSCLHNISEGSLEIFTKTEEEISYEELMNWLGIYKLMSLRSKVFCMIYHKGVERSSLNLR